MSIYTDSGWHNLVLYEVILQCVGYCVILGCPQRSLVQKLLNWHDDKFAAHIEVKNSLPVTWSFDNNDLLQTATAQLSSSTDTFFNSILLCGSYIQLKCQLLWRDLSCSDLFVLTKFEMWRRCSYKQGSSRDFLPLFEDRICKENVMCQHVPLRILHHPIM